MDIDDEKARLRKTLRERRKAAQAAAGPEAAQRLADRLERLPLPTAAWIAGYVAHGSEIDPLPGLRRLAARGHDLCLPVVVAPGRPLVFRGWAEGLALEAGEFDIPVPAGGAELLPDVVLVPLVGFDRRGGRLGQGGGFYDRTLPLLRAAKPDLFTIGLAFSVQEVASVPRAANDADLDWIVTERETIGIHA
ncbi:5-formyltetrahydrofolate cyclo-ligase [Zavarzinia compransoris]|uniref:5-formyltetrahydrofolate cyclo-ligase n=1 Tax=Zavarzinia compransoris TaxID=1264899 RepID=A0A317E2C2_9PROT|nr:5-formyltetrahydrofolate cyclo-ligase [Zavarzinia compransoris]PWR20741.1 5-formyltetrahydrofolate cyclo-ligase [Zavarzinia compransoris]TDP44426.1 5-formyltetrahydrofolate cyclo-ligase [Zavarzinia compransoris]